MTKFDTDGKHLYIDGKKVLRGWESFSGWYWFATEKASEQTSDLGNGKPVKIRYSSAWFRALRRNGATLPRQRLKA